MEKYTTDIEKPKRSRAKRFVPSSLKGYLKPVKKRTKQKSIFEGADTKTGRSRFSLKGYLKKPVKKQTNSTTGPKSKKTMPKKTTSKKGY